MRLLALTKKTEKNHNPPKFPHKRRKKKQKAWFDKDLQALKKKTKNLSNLKHAQPGNLEIHNSHKESLKHYRDECKSKRSAFRQEKCDNMDKALLKI